MSRTTTQDPAEFLLAQYASDAGEAQYVRNVGVRGPQYGSINGALSGVIDRVLADVDAKRHIVGLHQEHDDFGICSTCGPDEAPLAYPCPTLRALLQPYADHADFRDEWLRQT